MKPHIEQARAYWEKTLSPGDTVIDATMGNGHDILFCVALLKGTGKIIGYDIQPAALAATESLLAHARESATLKLKSHRCFDERHADLIIYNLGYLPRGDKSITTLTETTLQSIQNALSIAKKAVSIMCYPGHAEGAREEKAILEFIKTLSLQEWDSAYHSFREGSPTLVWLQKKQTLGAS